MEKKVLKLLRNWTEKKILSVCYSDIDNTWTGLVIQKSKGEISILESFDHIELIKAALPSESSLPIVLGIIHQSVIWESFDQVLNSEIAYEKFNELIPSGKSEDFIIDFNENVIAIARTSLALKIIQELHEFQSQIVAIYLAPSLGIRIADYFLGAKNESKLTVGNFSYMKDENGLLSLMNEKDSSQQNIKIAEIIIEPPYINSFASAITYYNDPKPGQNSPLTKSGLTEVTYKKVYSQFKYPVLFSLLFILLFNSLVYFELNNENQILQEKSYQTQQLSQKIKEIDQFLLNNKHLSSQYQNKPYFSIFSDQIGIHTPKEVVLTKMTIHPPASKQKGKFEYQEGIAIIEGETINPNAFGLWIDKLKVLKWTKNVELIQYQQKDKNIEKAKFQVKIHYDATKI